MAELQKLLWLIIIVTYAYICIWIYYIMPLTTPDDIVDASDEDELVFTYIVIRHGKRTSKRSYKKDPYRDGIYWPEGLNQLNHQGKQTQFELGKLLRRRYGKLIGPGDYSPKKIFIQSSDADRCIMSAQCNAAGLYSDSDWQPIPVHIVPDQINCKKVIRLGNQYLQSDEIKAILTKHKRLCKFLEVYSGNRVRYVDGVPLFDDVLNAGQELMETRSRLSEWIQSVLKKSHDVLEYFAAIKYESFTHTLEGKKIKGGFMVRDIFDRLKNRTLGVSKPNDMFLYVTHGHNIVNILNTLNVYKHHVPSYSSSIHFELYKGADGYYVQLFYRRDNSEHLPPIEFPNCGTTKCPLNKLYQLYNDVLPKDNETLKSLCQLEN